MMAVVAAVVAAVFWFGWITAAVLLWSNGHQAAAVLSGPAWLAVYIGAVRAFRIGP